LKEPDPVVLAASAAALDAEASSAWGLPSLGLVEAAGRACAAALLAAKVRGEPALRPPVCAACGRGNNGADALVLLRALITAGALAPEEASVALAAREGGTEAQAQALLSVRALGVRCFDFAQKEAKAALSGARLIVDGVVGAGLHGALRDVPQAMVEFINENCAAVKAAVDVPSGAGDSPVAGGICLDADLSLAIEPRKASLYYPCFRQAAGKIIPVDGIFPKALITKYGEFHLYTWESAAALVPPLSGDVYKYTRGCVEVHAGAEGSTGAALIAARGAAAAGAGLVRLILDPAVYQVLAPRCGGIMAVNRAGEEIGRLENGRFLPDAALLGPGWGKGGERQAMLDAALTLEAEGLPVILDADAIHLAAGRTFHGNALLTPHLGELEAFCGLGKQEILCHTPEVLRELSRSKNCTIIFKSHLLWVSAPDGRVAIIDGMKPSLAAGGSGDLLAGLCAGIAGRLKKLHGENFDPFPCAVAAGALLMGTAGNSFDGPLVLAGKAAALAGAAWLEEYQ
jgi:NAD(P)H-hydrate epimerase